VLPNLSQLGTYTAVRPARDSPSCRSRGISLHVKAATPAIRERTPDASSLHERSSLASNVFYAVLELQYRKGANEKPTGLHQNDGRGRYRLPHSCC
jgi:hypothetical protein